MNASLSLSSLSTALSKFFNKYHAMIFFTVIGLLLAAAILMLYLSLQSTDTVDESTTMISSSFDQETADRIQRLRESNESRADLVFPSPRSNPFVE